MANPSVKQEIPLIQKIYYKYMTREFQNASARSKALLIINKNYASKSLIQSISGGAEIKGENIEGSFGSNISYAKDIETGTTEREPSVAELLIWVRRKVALGHIRLNDWIKSKALTPYKSSVANRIRKQSVETTMLNIAKRTALRIGRTGKLKSAKPYLQPSFDQLIRNFEKDTPLEIV